MATEIILKVHKEYKESLATVRDIDLLLIAEDQDNIWVRGIHEDHDLVNRLYQIRFATKFYLKDNYLFLKSNHTPERGFFKAAWVPIKSYIPVQLPIAALKGESPDYQIGFTLKKTTQLEPSIGMLTDRDSIKDYIIDAPAFRYNQLTFASSQDNQVLILGTPLLPVKGQEVWTYNNVLIPNGYTFGTKYHLDLLSKNKENNTFLLIKKDNSYETISKRNIQPLHRNAFIT